MSYDHNRVFTITVETNAVLAASIITEALYRLANDFTCEGDSATIRQVEETNEVTNLPREEFSPIIVKNGSDPLGARLPA